MVAQLGLSETNWLSETKKTITIGIKGYSLILLTFINHVAGDLLSIALTQAFACLSDEDAQHVAQSRSAYQQGEMQCHEEVTCFDAGGT